MKITDAIERYLEFRRPNTRKTYKGALSNFLTHMDVSGNSAVDKLLKHISAEQAASFLSETQKRIAPDGNRVSDNTLRLTYYALRAIFGHLTDMGIIDKNPWLSVGKLMSGRQQTQKRPTALVPFEKVETIISIPNPHTKEGIRDRAILALLFGCGLRRSELIALNLCDVMLSIKGTLYLELRRTKAGKRRQQPLPNWAGESFSNLVAQRKSEGAGPNDPLFPFYFMDGKARGRTSTETVYRLFRGYCKQLGIKAAPHAARATAATRLIEQGHTDRDVATFLGHASPQMVHVYDKRLRGLEDNAGKMLDFKAKTK
jgi:integrase/recombinase XerD